MQVKKIYNLKQQRRENIKLGRYVSCYFGAKATDFGLDNRALLSCMTVGLMVGWCDG